MHICHRILKLVKFWSDAPIATSRASYVCLASKTELYTDSIKCMSRVELYKSWMKYTLGNTNIRNKVIFEIGKTEILDNQPPSRTGFTILNPSVFCSA